MITIERTDADRDVLAELNVDPKDLADDGTDYQGVVVKKPWGHEVQLYKSGAFCFWRLALNGGEETSMHCHPGKKTMLFVEDGEAIVYTLTRQYNLRKGDVVHIEAGAFHRTRAESPVVLIEAESPPNKMDLVRYSDRYGRQGQGY